MAAVLLMTGPALAQSTGIPYGDQQELGGTREDVVPIPPRISPETATAATQEDLMPGIQPEVTQPGPILPGETPEDVMPAPGGGMMDEGAAPQGDSADPMYPPQGSQSRGEFGTPSESGPSLDTETGISETAVPSEMQTVTGTVNKINLKKGTLILKTEDGKSMELHADRAMLKDKQFKKGSQVTAQYQTQGAMNHVTSLAPAEGMGGVTQPSGTVQ